MTYTLLLAMSLAAAACGNDASAERVVPQPASASTTEPADVEPDGVRTVTAEEVVATLNTPQRLSPKQDVAVRTRDRALAPSERIAPVKPASNQQKPESKPVVSTAAKTSVVAINTEPGVVTEAVAEKREDKPAVAPTRTAPSHAAFSALLKRYVNTDGDVDYAGLKSQLPKLNAYLSTLSQNPPQDNWSRNERLAYWMNAYNAATLKLIAENYPLTSITKLDGGKPWDVKRVELGGTTYSLNEIENDIIRPRFKEPRIHFAVNCAAASCPPLRNEAYVASRLDAQLDEQTRAFVNDSRYNTFSSGTATVSKIFDWYGEDFGDLKTFLGKYHAGGAPSNVKFAEYDWALNKQ